MTGQTCPAQRSRLRFGATALTRGALLALSGLVSAQVAQAATTLAPFSRYVVSTRIASTAGSTVHVPAVINDAGEVGGAVVKQAAKVWKWLPPSGNVWDGSFGLFPKLVYTQYVNAYPAIWSGGVIRQLPQFGGTHSTWIRAKTATGQWLVATSAEPGRFPERVADRTIHIPLKHARFLSPQGLYSEVIGPTNDDAAELRADMNDAGVMAYQNVDYEAMDRAIHVVMNSQDRTVQAPEGLDEVRFAGLGDDGGILLSGYRLGSLPTCYLYRYGQYLPVNVTVPDAIVRSNCSGMLQDGTVLGSVTVANPLSSAVDRTAIYSWKEGQTTLLADFRPDMYKGIPSLDVIGMSDVGMVARKDVGKFGIFRNGVFIDALASAGIVMKSTEYAFMLSYNKSGQLLMQVQNDPANSRYYVVLTPR